MSFFRGLPPQIGGCPLGFQTRGPEKGTRVRGEFQENPLVKPHPINKFLKSDPENTV